jgi:GH18 family chitinase
MAHAAGADFIVLGYLYTHSVAEVERLRFDKLTHVNYSFVNTDGEGNLTQPDADVLRALVRLAKPAGVKVGLAVGGWNDGITTPFETMAADPVARARFVTGLGEMVDRFGLDGIDMDWEYPNRNSAADFLSLMRELHSHLKPRGKYLSCAVIAMDDEHGRWIKGEIFPLIDMLNIMAYDWKYNDNGGQQHSSYADAERSLDYWLRRGCPKEKAVLGVPFYGRMPAVTYKELIAREPSAAQRDSLGTIFYNGQPTMRRKTELAWRRGGGIMFWELSQDTSDDTSLLGAIDAAVRELKR